VPWDQGVCKVLLCGRLTGVDGDDEGISFYTVGDVDPPDMLDMRTTITGMGKGKTDIPGFAFALLL
jgi:hypothetical protein